MTSEFSIDADWTSADHGLEEVRQTSAFLQIAFNGRVATSVKDEWSRTVHDRVRLSAYPLALWFASSWWRLKWEPAPSGTPNVTWRMAHELAAAGYGFLWPRLAFDSDGETVDVVCRATPPDSKEPIRYLDDFRASVPADAFEQTIDHFVDLVVARLDAVGVRDTTLHALWREVRAERADAETSFYRQLEAELGFEPDEAPEGVIGKLQDLTSHAGKAAVTEIASACSGKDSATTLERLIQFTQSNGLQGEVRLPEGILRTLSDSTYRAGAPWERGRLIARSAREAWGLGGDSVEDETLAEIFGVGASAVQQQDGAPSESPLGMAIRNGSDRLKLLFRRRNRSGRRFEAARFLADHVMAPAGDCWLPATDSKTARQKMQRAFAAEFLCPIDALRAFLGDNFSNEAIEEAGERFSVSPLAVRSHLALNGLLPPF
jgi:hypothetical protein